MTATLIIGDVLDVLRSMPDDSVDMVMTSPPFLALRSYLAADHPLKAKEMGSEPTPGAFIDGQLDVVEELARVVAPHGSICVELGDTYAGSGGGGGDYLPGGMREGQPGFGGSAEKQRAGNAAHWRSKSARRSEWPSDKSLCLIPELYRIALAYGINPLTGRQTPTWRVRNVVRWHRPNPPVGALGDKFRPATSDMVIACKARDRYFDLDAVREPHKAHTLKYDGGTRPHYGERGGQGTVTEMENGAKSNPNGAPPLDTWVISTQGYPGSHYATFPPALCIKPILAMCPERVCTECGEPSRRIVDVTYERGSGGTTGTRRDLKEPDGRLNGTGAQGKPTMDRHTQTLGWTDCGHNSWRNGMVLDPFAGSGTTLSVATGHGRDAIGIDLDERNADLCRQRVGMFLEVETHKTEVPA